MTTRIKKNTIQNASECFDTLSQEHRSPAFVSLLERKSTNEQLSCGTFHKQQKTLGIAETIVAYVFLVNCITMKNNQSVPVGTY